jgi:mannose-6-phosphate isomerase-like protein (cupin superfamily)
MRISVYQKTAAAIMLLGGIAWAHPIRPQPDGSVYASAAQLRARVARPQDGLAYSVLPTGAHGPTLVIVRHDKTGDVEVHDKTGDVLVAQSGHARIVLGGKVIGGRQIAPGEWRGGKITGGVRHNFAPGDVVWIPAGLPHRIVVTSKTFVYLAMKYPLAHRSAPHDLSN